MKRFLCFCFSAAAGLILAGCPGTSKTFSPDPTLDITYNGKVNNNLTIEDVSAEGREFVISVKSNRDWEVMPALPDGHFPGLVANPGSGNKNETVSVTISVPANDGAARSKGITFMTTPEGDEEPLIRTVNVSQLAAGNHDPDATLDFTDASYTYYFDNFGNGTGNFGFYFTDFTDEHEFELCIDIVSDYFADYFDAIPAPGTYNASTTHAKFTITEDSYFYVWDSNGETELGITDGTFTFSRTGSMHTVDIDLELSDGRTLKSEYQGDIYGYYHANTTSDITVDFSGSNSVYIQAEEYLDGFWGVFMWIETDTTEAYLPLAINTERGLSTLPLGNFPMASVPWQGVPGTAEPMSVSEDFGEAIGCAYNEYNYETGEEIFTYAVPGEGFVNISQPNAGTHTIDFSFEDPNGYTVSGTYSGAVDVYGGGDYRAPKRSKAIRPAKSPAKSRLNIGKRR